MPVPSNLIRAIPTSRFAAREERFRPRVDLQPTNCTVPYPCTVQYCEYILPQTDLETIATAGAPETDDTQVPTPYGTFYHTSDRVHFRKYLRNLVPFAMQHVESLHLNSHSVITSTTVQYCQQQALDIPETPESPSGLLVTRAIWPDSHARNTATPAASDPTHDTIRQTATQPSNDQTGLQRDT